MTNKKLYIKTYGCQMNVYDSGKMADALAVQGYEMTEQVADADMVVINTCHIREKAAEKLYSDLGRLKPFKLARREQGQDMIITVAGCVAQAEGAEVFERAPFVDIVVGSQAYHRLPAMVGEAESMHRAGRKVRRRLLDTDFPSESKFDDLPAAQTGNISAFLAVQEGCDKFCSFCVVPYTRGAEFSRPADQILAEARNLVAKGAREITLLGQNVNAWHGIAPTAASHAAGSSEWGLGRLIQELAEIAGLARLRYTTSHPRDMADDLIAAHAEVPQLMPYLHLPVQSGSDAILKAMNRKHNADDYRRLVDRIRAAAPNLALSSDFIVGFPGESDADFADTLRLIRDVTYAQAFSFAYSVRPGTPAGEMGAQLSRQVKEERLAELQALLRDQQTAFNQSKIGQVMPVLFVEAGRKPGQLLGKSPWLQSVHLMGDPRLIGHILEVRIKDGHLNSLSGEFLMTEGDEDDWGDDHAACCAGH
jgi:tRNA-2-methylthio-N6-dimethylallyladenosine synthase